MSPRGTPPTKRARGLLACFNGRLLYSCGLIALSQVNFGSDQAAFANTQAMPYFKQQFGEFNEATGAYALDTVYLSLLNSINYVGFIFGLVTGNLLSRRYGHAIASLRLLRQGRYTEQEILDEFNDIQSSLAVTVEKGSFKELFQGTNRKRTLITIGTNIFLQLTGQNFSSVYGTIFIQSLGTVNPFAMSCVSTSIGLVMVLVTQFLSDKTGRVPLMIAGAFIQTAVLMTMGGLGTVRDPSDSIKNGIVAMSTLFTVGFCLGWAPLSHVVAAEIPTNALRDLTYALGSVFNLVIQFSISFSIPYLLSPQYAGLGSKVGFIFGSTAFLALLFSWFCIPECGGKTLEEIDELFLRGVPIRKFRHARVGTQSGESEVLKDVEGHGEKNTIVRETNVQ
ncbi:hypothetical protein ACHAQA_006238 [Verticillium albo-atrum]